MLTAALVPSIVVWLAVLAVSFIGLTGFARDTMHWNHWTNLLVPLSLDGISVSFGGWAFVAVKRRHHPGRAYKVVLSGAALSATLNFVHGRDTWSIWAGTYLAFLSVAAMVMFHELLYQFMNEVGDEQPLRSRYPHFGQRWLYAPVSTMRARWAWIVYPPDEDVKATIRNALSHSDAVSHGFRSQAGYTRGWKGDRPESQPQSLRAARTLKMPKVSSSNARSVADGQPRARKAHGDAVNAKDATDTASRLNSQAELLWIELARGGQILTGLELLDKVRELHGVSRTPRWAYYRRKRAMEEWAEEDVNSRFR